MNKFLLALPLLITAPLMSNGVDEEESINAKYFQWQNNKHNKNLDALIEDHKSIEKSLSDEHNEVLKNLDPEQYLDVMKKNIIGDFRDPSMVIITMAAAYRYCMHTLPLPDELQRTKENCMHYAPLMFKSIYKQILNDKKEVELLSDGINIDEKEEVLQILSEQEHTLKTSLKYFPQIMESMDKFFDEIDNNKLDN